MQNTIVILVTLLAAMYVARSWLPRRGCGGCGSCAETPAVNRTSLPMA